MQMKDLEDQKLKAEIDEIMRRVNRILSKLDTEDPGKRQNTERSGE
jgi:hypothetical protein